MECPLKFSIGLTKRRELKKVLHEKMNVAHQGRFFHRPPPHMIPWFLVYNHLIPLVEHQYPLPVQELDFRIFDLLRSHTRIPVSVAAFTASISLSYL